MANDFDTRTGRIAIEPLSPMPAGDSWPAKGWVGEVIPFVVRAFKEGADVLGVELVLIDPKGLQSVHPLELSKPGLDEWTAPAQPDSTGDWSFGFQAWVDPWRTWLKVAKAKVPLKMDLDLVLEEGVALLNRAVVELSSTEAIAERLGILTGSGKDPLSRLERLLSVESSGGDESIGLRDSVTAFAAIPLRVERARAGVGSWYEFFPRSEGARRHRDGSYSSGNFATAEKRLPAIAEMGFDVVYLPPIHPIGLSHRKGRNNSLTAAPTDPGSPWAIGDSSGGHDSIHPDLGTEEDFRHFVSAAGSLGIEVALDLALQCSPDHPWVSRHPEWFTKRADGTIAFAENPPKKYQDIYPLNFDNDPAGLWPAILEVVEHWISFGVRIFRVDNPHTKPLRFWEWLIDELHSRHPDVVLLAEAFTRPAPMNALARVGFQQSYTYFTWRNTKAELVEYLNSLSRESSDYLRPNLFVNTPDILTEYLQFGGKAAFKIRVAVAATASPSWGVYSGFELMENVARPGSEEYIDNEKYEFKPRDWAKARRDGNSISDYLTRLNQIRAAHPALQQLRNLSLHWSDDDSILVFSKRIPGEFTTDSNSDTIIVVANLDPHAVRETTVHLDLAALGRESQESFEVTDLITGAVFNWSRDNYVRLDPFGEPVHILHLGESAESTLKRPSGSSAISSEAGPG